MLRRPRSCALVSRVSLRALEEGLTLSVQRVLLKGLVENVQLHHVQHTEHNCRQEDMRIEERRLAQLVRWLRIFWVLSSLCLGIIGDFKRRQVVNLADLALVMLVRMAHQKGVYQRAKEADGVVEGHKNGQREHFVRKASVADK